MAHALIIGGGISGAVTAMALHKAGISSVIHEACAGQAGNADPNWLYGHHIEWDLPTTQLG